MRGRVQLGVWGRAVRESFGEGKMKGGGEGG